MIKSVALAVVFGLPLFPQVQPGPQILTFLSDVDDSDQPYAIYVPPGYSSAKKYPLVISLHGAGSNHRLNLRRVFGQGNRMGETDVEATRYFPRLKDVDMIVASPYARGTMGYTGIAERDLYDVLADVQRRFSIDEDRIYLTGLSMGGGGTLLLGLTRPDVWAAIAPVCPAPPPGLEELAGNALNLPVKIFQGSIDPLVTPENVRAWQKRFVEAGVPSEYVEYPGVRHNSWDSAYKGGAIFDWFANYRRNRTPDRVRFATTAYKYNSAYWVRFDSLTPGQLAAMDARFEGKNKLRIDTSGVDAFTLTLRGHPMFVPSQPVLISVNGVALRAKRQPVLSVSRAGTRWVLKGLVPLQTQKRPGAEGPIAAAVSSRHIYIYGTSGSPSKEELQRRRGEAAQAAEWSTPSSRLMLNFQVLADTDVKDSDIQSSNLVLFGTKETNALIARFQARLPLSLNPGAADYGLLYVYSLDGRYVLVSSGLPWWTRVDQVRLSGFHFSGPIMRPLATFGDYVIFKGGLDNIVAQGRFDRDWKLSPEALESLTNMGAVEVRR